MRSTTIEPTLALYVSLMPADSDRIHLIALSCKLGKDYAGEDAFGVFFFDSKRAAKRWVPAGDPGNDVATEKSFLGKYTLLRAPEISGQFLTLRVRGGNYESVTEIELGPPPPRPNRSVGGR